MIGEGGVRLVRVECVIGECVWLEWCAICVW